MVALTECHHVFRRHFDANNGRVVDTTGDSVLGVFDSVADAVLCAICVGGDTDTIGAMTGALAGAFHGVGAIPPEWLRVLENDGKGMDYLRGLGESLHALYLIRD